MVRSIYKIINKPTYVYAGVDLGSKKLGLAYLNNKENIVVTETIYSLFNNSDDRIINIADQVRNSLELYCPDCVFVEDCIFIQNFATSKLLSNLQGMIKWVCSELYIPIVVIAPTAWRVICGGGKATKNDIMSFAVQRWPNHIFNSQDACDACCIALYGLQQYIKKNG